MRRTALSAEHELGDLDDTDFVICDETIENRLHYVRDVTLGEDASRVRSGSAPQVLAALRNAVIALLRATGATNMAAAVRDLAWQNSALALLGLDTP